MSRPISRQFWRLWCKIWSMKSQMKFSFGWGGLNPNSLSPNCTVVMKKSNVSTSQSHGKIRLVVIRRVARAILMSWMLSKSFVGCPDSLSRHPLAPSRAWEDIIFIEKSVHPGLCNFAIRTLLILSPVPVPSKSYFETGSRPVRPKFCLACIHMSIFSGSVSDELVLSGSVPPSSELASVSVSGD